MDNRVETDAEGTIRGALVQGRRAQLGPLQVGVMAAREGTLDDGTTGLFAKLELATADESRIVVLRPGESVRIAGAGELTLHGVRPPGGPDDGPELVDRGIVAVVLRPGPPEHLLRVR